MTNPHRTAVLADIHGNLPALEAVLADARAQGAGQFLVAGDFLARAPYPLETLRRLQALDASLILGNADVYQIDYARGGLPLGKHSAHLYDVIRWTNARLSAHDIAAVAAQPAERVVELAGWPPIRLVHGLPGKPNGGLIPVADRPALQAVRAASAWPEDVDPPPMAQQVGELAESLLICGHTHISFIDPPLSVQPRSEPAETAQISGRAYRLSNEAADQPSAGEQPLRVINPGSVGFGVEGDPRARYMLIEWRAGAWQVERRAVSYDLESLRASFHASGLLAEGGAFARSCLGVALTGQNASMLFIRSLMKMEEQAGDYEEAWARAEAAFDWQRYGV